MFISDKNRVKLETVLISENRVIWGPPVVEFTTIFVITFFSGISLPQNINGNGENHSY